MKYDCLISIIMFFTLSKSVKGKITPQSNSLLGKTLINEGKHLGRYKVIWDGRDNLGNQVCLGIYFCRLTQGSLSQIREMILMR